MIRYFALCSPLIRFNYARPLYAFLSLFIWGVFSAKEIRNTNSASSIAKGIRKRKEYEQGANANKGRTKNESETKAKANEQRTNKRRKAPDTTFALCSPLHPPCYLSCPKWLTALTVTAAKGGLFISRICCKKPAFINFFRICENKSLTVEELIHPFLIMFLRIPSALHTLYLSHFCIISCEYFTISCEYFWESCKDSSFWRKTVIFTENKWIFGLSAKNRYSQ